MEDMIERDPRADDWRKSKKGVANAKKCLGTLRLIEDESWDDDMELALMAGVHYGWATEEGDRSLRAIENASRRGSGNRIPDAERRKIIKQVKYHTDHGASKRQAVNLAAEFFDRGVSTVWKILSE